MKQLTKFFIPLITVALMLNSCGSGNDVNNLSVGEFVDGHYAVDLGLDVMWATCNVGAAKPELSGWHFAWGETNRQDVSKYTWMSYGLIDKDSNLKKYNLDPSHGIVDNKDSLEAENDAAVANWKGQWRMPTAEEQDQLRHECSWTFCRINGVEGYKVTGKNGRSIFLPSAGIYSDGELIKQRGYGLYWSCNLDKTDSEEALAIEICDEYFDYVSEERCVGATIRAVCPIQQFQFPDLYE